VSSALILRGRIESALSHKYSAALTPRPNHVPELVPTGIPPLDQALCGGIPRATITEVCGSALHSSGSTSLMLSILALRTRAAERCALVDASDCLSPASITRAGIQSSYLLWQRCGGDGRRIKNVKTKLKALEQAVAVADLVLKSGSFGTICLDLTDIAEDALLRVPLTSWWRFSSALKNTTTTFVLLVTRSVAKSCAGLVLELGFRSARWQAGQGQEFSISAQSAPTSFCRPLPLSIELGARVLQARAFDASVRKRVQSAHTEFQIETMWA
jgi:hypothetical protein